MRKLKKIGPFFCIIAISLLGVCVSIYEYHDLVTTYPWLRTVFTNAFWWAIGILIVMEVLLTVFLWITYAWNYHDIQMALISDINKKEKEKAKVFKGLVELSTFLTITLLLLYFILLRQYG